MHIVILDRPFGTQIAGGAMTGPADLHDAVSRIDAHAVSIAVDHDGIVRQVHSRDEWGRVRPYVMLAGMARLASAKHDAEAAWQHCIAELVHEAIRDEEVRVTPRYRLHSEAAADGWHVRHHVEEDYRGWCITLWHERDNLRAELRRHSGHGPNGLDFSRIIPPRPPETHPLEVDAQLNNIGRRHMLYRLTRRSEVLAWFDECRRLIDRREDGRNDIDTAA